MILVLLAAATVLAYLALLVGIAILAGRLLARVSERYPVVEPVRCSCRRHAFPSPRCPVHGGTQ